ncbi:hypothetical protein N7466_002373 [Penicillium verhagenii]|uniref:uncharacterized protein n=1 Tax=Penicillium verhagenii TaxID=1562060 RepID=UPI0025458571|nr:uncharacterized protein N7466_002373 [Penicillium verhagenii]KAJ5939239.1 hypothetical protein N7466_002373 [Penicillium verhagenii]
MAIAFGAMIHGGLAEITVTPDADMPPPTLYDFDNDGVAGGLYRPAFNSTKARIAVYVMHAESDYMTFSACRELPRRGFTVFCANNAADKTGVMSSIYFEDELTQADYGMQYLRNLTDIDKVVLFGHSGGGGLMTAFQNVAENGISACQGPNKLYNCTSAVADLHPADGIMLLDANYGLGTMPFLSLNPALEGLHGTTVNETLNLFNPVNGFIKGNSSRYTSKFKKAYQEGVVARNDFIIKYAQERLAALEANETGLIDDEPLYVTDSAYGVMNNKFFAQDTRYLAHTSLPWPLLHKDGSITTQVVKSVRVPVNFESYANQYIQGALKTTVRRYLSTFAIRATSDFDIMPTGFHGIDHSSAQFSPTESIKGVRVPLLNMGMTGHWEYLNAEKIHLNAPGNDTAIVFVEGAEHKIGTCKACESYPGQYGNTMKTAYNYIEEWLTKPGRFLD